VGEDQQAERTFVFADMAGFTALTETMGDDEAVTVSEGFFGAARELLADHGATEVKTIGDALMLEVESPDSAIRLGLRLAYEVGARHGFPSVRVGMHTGPAVQRGEDWFGATVNLAARVSGAAGGGEVLLTEATRAGAGDVQGIRLVEHGQQELRNISEPVPLFRAVSQGAVADGDSLPIDPVCRMAVEPDHQAGQLPHDGVEYHFCSLDCIRRFVDEPMRFVQD
jgi:adenylate cyclase